MSKNRSTFPAPGEYRESCKATHFGGLLATCYPLASPPEGDQEGAAGIPPGAQGPEDSGGGVRWPTNVGGPLNDIDMISILNGPKQIYPYFTSSHSGRGRSSLQRMIYQIRSLGQFRCFSADSSM